jgi:hypothetical protein
MSPSSNTETGKSNATHEEQDGENDQDDTDDTHPTVTEAVTAEAPTKAAKQEDDKDDYQQKSDRHGYSALVGPKQTLSFFLVDCCLLLFDGNATLADADLDAGGLLPCLVNLIAEYHSDNG